MTELVEVKTAELTGAALDWAVAVTEFGKVYVYPDGGLCPPEGTVSMNEDDGSLWTNNGDFHHDAEWAPSRSWYQAGPLIEKHRVDLIWERAGFIAAYLSDEDGYPQSTDIYGPTHPIAACRAIVAHKLGDTVSVPKELMP